MKKLIPVFLLFFSIHTLTAQIDWSVNLGGGVTYLEDVFGDYPWPHYTGGAMFQAGTSISSLFMKEGMVGWEAGVNIITSGYYLVPDKDMNGSSTGINWDYANRTSHRDWYVQVPVSFSFNMFEGTGFLLGARINRRLTNINRYTDSFPKWIPAAHLGVFTHISPRIRLDATAFMDLTKRLDIKNPLSKGLREYGDSLNIRYTLK